jgi:serine protease Do
MQVAKKTIPAVVHIELTERQAGTNPLAPFGNDPFWQRFFGAQQVPKKFKREVRGLGSGMIMDAAGHILTNEHVVGSATRIEVLLANGQRYVARVVGTDPKTDLAVIKIDAKEALPAVTFGDSDRIEVGEWVVAIGHPRGLDQTVTHGIISAKHRRGITEPSSYQDFLQTDAAINPGSSGGPLLNLHGEVVGVNAVIASQTGAFEGIGFAIPSNMAAYVAQALITHGKIERAWLGVSLQEISPELARGLGVDMSRGAVIAEVIKGSPAERAGLKKGDVVVGYQGKDVTSADALRNAVAITPVDQEVQMTIVRGGQKQELSTTVRKLEEATRTLLAAVQKRLGVTVRPVSPQEAEKYGLEARQGVAITRVDANSALGKAGLEVRDVLLAIDEQPIESLEDLVHLVSAVQPQQRITISALDHRSGNTGDLQVTLR